MDTCFLLLYARMYELNNNIKPGRRAYVRLLVLAAVFALAFTTASCKRTNIKPSDQAESLFKLGQSHLVTGATQAAFVKFHEALLIKPKHKKALNGLGYVYLDRKDFKKAEESFRKAIKSDKTYSEAHNNLCFTLSMQGRHEEALTACRKALKNPVYPTPEKSYYNMGRIYHKMVRYSEAIKAYEDAIKRYPNFYPGYYAKALTHNSFRQYGAAADAMNLALGLDPRFQGDKKIAERTFIELRNKGVMDPGEVNQYLEILHY